MKKHPKVLLLIDVLRDFLEEDGTLYCGPSARRIIPYLAKQIAAFRRLGRPVIYLCDAHRKNADEFRLFPPHARRGSRGGQIIAELAPCPKDFIVYKNTYDAFIGTTLERLLRRLGAKTVVVGGVCTSICIMETVGQLFYRGYEPIVLKKGVADFSPRMHRFALQRMKLVYGVKFV